MRVSPLEVLRHIEPRIDLNADVERVLRALGSWFSFVLNRRPVIEPSASLLSSEQAWFEGKKGTKGLSTDWEQLVDNPLSRAVLDARPDFVGLALGGSVLSTEGTLGAADRLLLRGSGGEATLDDRTPCSRTLRS